MLRKLCLVVPVLALFLVPTVAHAQFEAGNWELTLAGQGSNDKDFTTFDASVQFSLGYFLTKELEVSVREAATYADGGSAYVFNTSGAIDYHFDLDRWQPFVGWNIGKACATGTSVNDDFFTGPEVGVKYFVNSTTFIALTAAYEFDLEEGLDTGAFLYNLAIGFKW
jgi:hypothetical protein